MKSFDTELKKHAEKIRLKVSERHDLRERILSYMEYHPLPKQALSVEELRGAIPSEAFRTFHFTWFQARVAGGVLAVILILAPFAAERAVPGEVLYLVKTGINEPIQKQLATTPHEKIEFETKLMDRRIAEARVLASEGKLTEEVKAEITANVKEHTKAVQTGIEELKAEDAEGAAIAKIAFNSKLEVQSAVLGAERHTEDTELIAAVQVVVDEARVEVASSQVENKPSFEGLAAQVEIETTRAYELFASVKESATKEEVADIERRLSDANRLFAEAREKKDRVALAKVAEPEAEPEDGTETATTAPSAEPVGEPIVALMAEPVLEMSEVDPADDLAKTLGLIQKLIVFMTDIDVRKNVALETLVPMVLSTEERIASARAELDAISAIALAVEARLPEIGDEGVKAKIEEGLSRIAEITEGVPVTLDAGDVAGAETQLTNARALANDIDTISKHPGIGIPEPETEEEETPEVVVPAEEVGTSTDPSATTTESVVGEF